MVAPPVFADVLAAEARVRPWIHRTPVLRCATLDRQSGAELLFKCENFQKGGAFKARGATNAVFSLPESHDEAGVITHSSGNHAIGLAYAAQCRGIRCEVVMPSTAPVAKKAAVAEYGGQIIECEPTASAREGTVAERQRETGADFVHPYNDPRVIAGQATCALELLDQAADLDVLVTPVGGGGLISGCALALEARAAAVRLYGAEPAQADDAARSLQAGELIADEAPKTIADGLKMPLAPLTWHFVRQHVDDIFTVSEAAIIEAMRLTWERMKIVIEPSCAVPMAAILANPAPFRGKRVGVVITGGNVDLDRLPWLADPGTAGA